MDKYYLSVQIFTEIRTANGVPVPIVRPLQVRPGQIPPRLRAHHRANGMILASLLP